MPPAFSHWLTATTTLPSPAATAASLGLPAASLVPRNDVVANITSILGDMARILMAHENSTNFLSAHHGGGINGSGISRDLKSTVILSIVFGIFALFGLLAFVMSLVWFYIEETDRDKEVDKLACVMRRESSGYGRVNERANATANGKWNGVVPKIIIGDSDAADGEGENAAEPQLRQNRQKNWGRIWPGDKRISKGQR
ncbi:hypothetical protein PVAG01_10241 [Phlyctema vagabunda]|uniref:Uncharacterized protein n=1 Tax=Phlyctema vagabunda TaxID=108571 RepID=A0ABR4P5F5_9HELO